MLTSITSPPIYKFSSLGFRFSLGTPGAKPVGIPGTPAAPGTPGVKPAGTPGAKPAGTPGTPAAPGAKPSTPVTPGTPGAGLGGGGGGGGNFPMFELYRNRLLRGSLLQANILTY